MKVYKVNEHLFEKSNKFIGEKEVDWMRYVTLQQGTGGSISANPLSGRKGTIVNLSQTTNTDYRFDGYSITGANLSSNQFAINNSDVTAQGIFTYYPKRSVTVTQQTGGTVVANPTTGHDGDTVTLSQTANAGYTFNNYSITGATLTGSQFNFSGSNVSVKPNYTHNVYNLTLQTNGHGKLVAGKTTGYYNDTTTLTATPSSNYVFDSYSITGGSITNNTYKWGATNGTVRVNFIKTLNPLNLPDKTIRVKFKSGYTPTMGDTRTLVDATNNVWDIYKQSELWGGLFGSCHDLTDVLGANTTNVTNTNGMFNFCSALSSFILFDTSKVLNMSYMFSYCWSLTAVPLLDTTKVISTLSMFGECTNVQNGALALYKQLSTQTNPPSQHTQTFRNCGKNTQTGAAELAQIPDGWK